MFAFCLRNELSIHLCGVSQDDVALLIVDDVVEGLRGLVERFPNDDLACEPALEAAATPLGFAVRDATSAENIVRATVATWACGSAIAFDRFDVVPLSMLVLGATRLLRCPLTRSSGSVVVEIDDQAGDVRAPPLFCDWKLTGAADDGVTIHFEHDGWLAAGRARSRRSVGGPMPDALRVRVAFIHDVWAEAQQAVAEVLGIERVPVVQVERGEGPSLVDMKTLSGTAAAWAIAGVLHGLSAAFQAEEGFPLRTRSITTELAAGSTLLRTTVTAVEPPVADPTQPLLANPRARVAELIAEHPGVSPETLLLFSGAARLHDLATRFRTGVVRVLQGSSTDRDEATETFVWYSLDVDPQLSAVVVFPDRDRLATFERVMLGDDGLPFEGAMRVQFHPPGTALPPALEALRDELARNAIPGVVTSIDGTSYVVDDPFVLRIAGTMLHLLADHCARGEEQRHEIAMWHPGLDVTLTLEPLPVAWATLQV